MRQDTIDARTSSRKDGSPGSLFKVVALEDAAAKRRQRRASMSDILKYTYTEDASISDLTKMDSLKVLALSTLLKLRHEERAEEEEEEEDLLKETTVTIRPEKKRREPRHAKVTVSPDSKEQNTDKIKRISRSNSKKEEEERGHREEKSKRRSLSKDKIVEEKEASGGKSKGSSRSKSIQKGTHDNEKERKKSRSKDRQSSHSTSMPRSITSSKSASKDNDQSSTEEKPEGSTKQKSRASPGSPHRTTIEITEKEGGDALINRTRIRRTSSHDKGVKRRGTQKSKSMDEKISRLVLGHDDATVVADNKSVLPSSNRRLRRETVSRRPVSLIAVEVPAAVESPASRTPTKHRSTRRRASVTGPVLVVDATEGSSELGASNRLTPTRNGSMPASNRSSRAHRSSRVVGSHQLRQALAQSQVALLASDLEVDPVLENPSKQVAAAASSKPTIPASPEDPPMPAIPVNDDDEETETGTETETETDTDAEDQGTIITRLPTAYQQRDHNTTSLSALSSREIRLRLSMSDRLSSSSQQGRPSLANALPDSLSSSSSSCNLPRSYSSGSLPSTSGHEMRASSRFSISRVHDPLAMPSSSYHGPMTTTTTSSKPRRDLLSSSAYGPSSKSRRDLLSSSAHGRQPKSWFPSFHKKQPDLLDPLTSSSGHGPSKRATSPSRKVAIQRRGGTTMEAMDISSSSRGVVLPMLQGETSKKKIGGSRQSPPGNSKNKKVTISLPKKEKFSDLDDDVNLSDDDFAY